MIKVSKYLQYIRSRIQNNRKLFRVYTVLRILVILTMIRQFFMSNYEGVAICILSLFLFLLPGIMEDHFKIEIPPVFEAIIYSVGADDKRGKG